MRKFTKEIAALLATAAVSASAGAATASSAEEAVRTEGVAINPEVTAPVTTAYDPSWDEEPTFSEGTFEATTTTTTGTYLMGTQVYNNTTTTTTTTATEWEDTPLAGDIIETTPNEDDETYWAGVDMPVTTTTAFDDWGTSMIGTQVETTTTTTTDDTWFAGGIMDIHSGNGDANLDGKLSVADSVTILQYIGNNDKYAISEEQRESADCYNPGDGLTPMDALTIQRVDAGVLSEDDLPVYPQSDN